MKKKFICTVITAIMLICCTSCSSNGSEEKIMGDIDLGVTKNQVREQLSEYESLDMGLWLTYQDVVLFGQYCKKAQFHFRDEELYGISIEYPSGADEKKLYNSLKKAYGKQEYSFDDTTSFEWEHGNAIIFFNKRTDNLDTRISIVDKDVLEEETE